MAQQRERYLIGPGLRDKLREVIGRLDGVPVGSGGINSTTVRLQSMPTRGGFPIKIAAYSTGGAQWNKWTVRNVHAHDLVEANGVYSAVPLYSGNGAPYLITVLNIFSTIAPNYDAIRYCAYASVNGVNLVIAAEC